MVDNNSNFEITSELQKQRIKSIIDKYIKNQDSSEQAVKEVMKLLKEGDCQPLNYGFIKDLALSESETAFVDALKKIAKLSGKSEKYRYGLWKPTREEQTKATTFSVDIKCVDCSEELKKDDKESILIPFGLLKKIEEAKEEAKATAEFHLDTNVTPELATIPSLAFDGKKDYIEIESNDIDINFNTDEEFTVEVWVKVASIQSDVQYDDNSIVEKWDARSDRYPYAIRYENTTGRIVAIRFDGKNQPILSSETNINDGKFHHIAFVKRCKAESNQEREPNEEKKLDTDEYKLGLHLYINGKHEAYKEDNTNDTRNTVPLYLACRAGTRNYFRGQIGEVAIWKIAVPKASLQHRVESYQDSKKNPQQDVSPKEHDSPSELLRYSPLGEVFIKNKPQKPQIHGTPGLIEFEHWSSVKNQGAIQSCTINAVTSLLEYFQHKASGNSEDISRLFIYKNTRDLMSLEKETPPGASIRQTLAAIEMLGALPEKYWPYHPFLVDREPFDFCYALAKNYRLTGYCRLDQPNMDEFALLDQVKVFIMAGLHPIFGFPLNTSVARAARYEYPDRTDTEGKIVFDYFDKDSQGHAVIAVGYDNSMRICNFNPNPQFKDQLSQLITDKKIQSFINIEPKNDNYVIHTKGALKIRNSWGREWGENGYGWLPYAYVLAGLTVDWWSILKTDWFNTEYFGQSLGTETGGVIKGG
jgi:C1A family cysteine protease